MENDNALLYPFSPIGFISTPYRQKFAIPRQSNLAPVNGQLWFREDIDVAACCHGLDNFSHLWLIFAFHHTQQRGWKARVKAPRLGGNHTLGVFASRSTHRPNPIGLSVVSHQGLTRAEGKWVLQLQGVDLLDGTPILDIKPYLPYADNVPDAVDQLTTTYPHRCRDVSFSPAALTQLHALSPAAEQWQLEIEAILTQDPRPAYRQSLDHDERAYFLALYHLDIRWQVKDAGILVQAVVSTR